MRDVADIVQSKSGLPLSPYFSAAKIKWLLQNTPEIDRKNLCAGTIDSWLIFKLTGEFKTDYSNAARTQLLNIHTLKWDEELCELFNISLDMLAEVCSSDAEFGKTDFEGLLPHPIPVRSVLGDSNGALFGQGCLRPGMAKVTYGTGSSVMVNVGSEKINSACGLSTSIAWKRGDCVQYVLEGNINYSGAVMQWLKNDVGILTSASEASKLAKCANPEDDCYLVPAFSGLGAPYWDNNAQAILCGMTRKTGRAEIVQAAEQSIAYQIADIVQSMETDKITLSGGLKVDGGATKDTYLMQFQSDILQKQIFVSSIQELSCMGTSYLAGMALNLYTEEIFDTVQYDIYLPQMSLEERDIRYEGWHKAVQKACY